MNTDLPQQPIQQAERKSRALRSVATQTDMRLIVFKPPMADQQGQAEPNIVPIVVAAPRIMPTAMHNTGNLLSALTAMCLVWFFLTYLSGDINWHQIVVNLRNLLRPDRDIDPIEETTFWHKLYELFRAV